jgi:hypothetical protein
MVYNGEIRINSINGHDCGNRLIPSDPFITDYYHWEVGSEETDMLTYIIYAKNSVTLQVGIWGTGDWYLGPPWSYPQLSLEIVYEITLIPDGIQLFLKEAYGIDVPTKFIVTYNSPAL